MKKTPVAALILLGGVVSPLLALAEHVPDEEAVREEDSCWHPWLPSGDSYDVPTNTRIWGLEPELSHEGTIIRQELWNSADEPVAVDLSYIETPTYRMPVWTPREELEPNAEYWIVRVSDTSSRKAISGVDAGAAPDAGTSADADPERLRIFITGDGPDTRADPLPPLSGIGSGGSSRDFSFGNDDELGLILLADLSASPSFEPSDFSGTVRWANASATMNISGPCTAPWPAEDPDHFFLAAFDLAGNFSGWRRQQASFPEDEASGCHVTRSRPATGGDFDGVASWALMLTLLAFRRRLS